MNNNEMEFEFLNNIQKEKKKKSGFWFWLFYIILWILYIVFGVFCLFVEIVVSILFVGSLTHKRKHKRWF